MKTFNKSLVFVVIVLFIGAGFVPSIISDNPSFGNTIYVDDNANPSWYDATHVKTIQEGVNNASSGDTVFVYNGTYYENVVVNKTINLTGEDKNSTTINSSGSGDVVYISADLVNISEFSIRNSGSNWQDAGIDIISSNNTISGNTISNNNWGIWLYNSNNNVITDNTISNNSLIGVSLVGYDEGNVIVDNTIINNSCAGIKLENMSNYNLIAHNYIGYNGENSGCKGGILIFTGCGAQYNNTICCNTLESNREYGIYCMAGSPRNNSIYHNNFINNTQNADDGGTNFWHNTTLQEGNYWSDFDEPSEGAWDNNSDGIVDTPYNISGGSNQDLYPFMNPNGWDNTSNLQPVADFTYSPMYPTTNDQVQFNDTSIDLDGEIDTWYWNFGDGNTSEEQNPTHQFLDNLTYNVTLTVIDDNGANDTITKQVITKSVYIISVPPYNETVIDDFLNETGTIITINVTNSTNISISSYSGNPTNENISSNITAVGNYIDIVVENDSYVIWPINLTIYYTQNDIDNAGVTEGELIGIFFYNESSLDWQLFNDTGVNATYNDDSYEGYCWANVWHLTNITLGGRFKLPDVYVDDDASPGWYDATHVRTIQEGIDNASSGDTVFVYNGTYYENVDISKSVNLIGNSSTNCIVNASDPNDHAFEVTSDFVNISGFTIENVTDYNKAGIYLQNSNYSSIFNNNASNNDNGIYLYYSNNNNITDNNANSNNNDGISLSSSYNNTITGNNASNNNQGIDLQYSSNNNTITGNNANSNNYPGINLFSSSNNNTITGNNASNNNLGIEVDYSSNNNNITGNNANSNNLYGIHIGFSSNNNTITGNNASNNSCGIHLYSTSNNNTITRNNVSNNGNGIYLYYSNNNNITGNNANLNNFYGIYLGYSSNNNTITGNNANLNNNHGIYLQSSSNNNTITGNNASNNSYGISLSSSYNNTITGNNANLNNNHGISLYSSSNNTITGNNANLNNNNGIYLHYSDNNNITSNNVSNNNDGIYLFYSYNNNVTGNNASNNSYGIHPVSSDNNNITGNNASNNSYGIFLMYSSNNTINDNIANLNDQYGVRLYLSCNNNTITGNNASNNSYGIQLYSSSNNTITDNNANSNNNNGIVLLDSSNNNTITGNNASNNNQGIDLQYSSNNNTITDNNANSNNNDGISLSSSYNNTITGNNASNNYDGIYLWDSYSNKIDNNIIINNTNEGIGFTDSCYNIINDNIITSNNNDGIGISASCNNNNLTNNTIISNNDDGILISSSSKNNYIFNNIITSNNDDGIYIVGSSNSNQVISNIISLNNEDGIELSYSNNNSITGNNLSSNINNGIKITYSSDNNLIYYNKLINNTLNGYDECTNFWYNTTLQEGNYYDDYYGNDADGDGIGEIPYNISGGSNQDLYPLGIFNQPPIADFNYTPILPNQGETVQFNATAVDYDGTIVNYTWYFGYHIIYGKNPTYQFNLSGLYPILLEVKDDNDGTDTVAKSIPVSFDMMHITNTSVGWNFISTPYNQQLSSDEFFCKYDGYYYDWGLATTDINPTGSPLINSYMFGWNRTQQTYTFETNLDPGYGYWMYAYQPVEIWIQEYTAPVDDNITDLEQGWNILGVPYNQPVGKADIIVNDGNFDYNWTDAVSAGIINNFVFGWDRDGQGYTFSDTFEPGYSYWLYAYQQCTLKRNES